VSSLFPKIGRNYWLLSLIVMVNVTGEAQTGSPGTASYGREQGSSKPRLGITIRVFNYAHTSSGTVAGAEELAATIFRECGVETVWLDCPLSSATAQQLTACQEPPKSTELILRIVPQFEVVPAGFRDTTFGFALPYQNPEGERGLYATVFYFPVKELAQHMEIGVSQVLGPAIAHEIGHLLLGSITHSSSGIMQAQWGREELLRALTDRLLFTSEQAKLLRAKVQVRMRNLSRD
jgi:hypothetical protein